MHTEAMAWVARYADTTPGILLDIGGRNVNGSATEYFPFMTVTTLDIEPDVGVDIVANAAEWTPTAAWDVVLCTEVFEHTAEWPEIVRTAYEALRPGGRLIATMAGPDRPAHSMFDGNSLRPGEYYGNVEPRDLLHELREAGFVEIVVDHRPSPSDVRCYAEKP